MKFLAGDFANSCLACAKRGEILDSTRHRVAKEAEDDSASLFATDRNIEEDFFCHCVYCFLVFHIDHGRKLSSALGTVLIFIVTILEI